MKSRALLAAILAAVSLFATRSAAQADDLKALEGKWTVESIEAGGKQIEAEGIKELVIRISGATYQIQTKDGLDAGTLQLDETKNPKTMDATDTEGFDAGKLIKAIYEIAGDTLRVCYAIDGGARPTELKTVQDSPWLLLTYKREK